MIRLQGLSRGVWMAQSWTGQRRMLQSTATPGSSPQSSSDALPPMVHVATHPSEILIDSPSSVYTYVLESVHAYTGMPWWVVIPTVAFVGRFAMLPILRAHQRRREELIGPLQPELTQLSLAASQSVKEGKGLWSSLRVWRQERREVLKKCPAGHVSRNFFMYGYIGVVMTQVMGLRYGLQIDPSFVEEGVLWFPSLLQHDPWLRLNWILFCASTATLVSLFSLFIYFIIPLIGMQLPFPASFQGKIAFSLLSVGFFATIPISHLTGMPEGIVLHFLGVTAFRFIDKTWLQKRILSPVHPSSAIQQKGNPRW